MTSSREDRLRDFLAELNDLQRKYQIQIEVSEWASITEYDLHQWAIQYDWRVKDERQFTEHGSAELVPA